jgi:hypothetical protein
MLPQTTDLRKVKITMAYHHSGSDLVDDSSGSDEPDESDSSSSASSLSASAPVGGIAEAFMNECVTIRFASGRTVTGFFQAIADGLVRLFVAGSPVLVSLATVETISLAGPNAC